MNDLINTTNLNTVDFINCKFTNVRYVTKCRAGWMTITEARDFEIEGLNNNPERLITGYKKGALQTVEVEFDNSGYYITVFARVGKKVKLIDEAILKDLTVGTINGLYYNTNLYSQAQYAAVGSKTWASKAYVSNVTKELVASH